MTASPRPARQAEPSETSSPRGAPARAPRVCPPPRTPPEASQPLPLRAAGARALAGLWHSRPSRGRHLGPCSRDWWAAPPLGLRFLVCVCEPEAGWRGCCPASLLSPVLRGTCAHSAAGPHPPGQRCPPHLCLLAGGFSLPARRPASCPLLVRVLLADVAVDNCARVRPSRRCPPAQQHRCGPCPAGCASGHGGLPRVLLGTHTQRAG